MGLCCDKLLIGVCGRLLPMPEKGKSLTYVDICNTLLQNNINVNDEKINIKKFIHKRRYYSTSYEDFSKWLSSEMTNLLKYDKYDYAFILYTNCKEWFNKLNIIYPPCFGIISINMKLLNFIITPDKEFFLIDSCNNIIYTIDISQNDYIDLIIL